MKMIIEVKLKEGCYTDDMKKVDILDEQGNKIAEKVDVNYAKLIIKSVNEYKD